MAAGQGNGAKQGTTAIFPLRNSIRDVVLTLSRNFLRNLEGTYFKETLKTESTKFRTLELSEKTLFGNGRTQLSPRGHSSLKATGSATSSISQISGARSSANKLQLTSRIYENVRNIFQNAFVKRANSNSQAAIWRRKTAKQLLNGNATPFLALVGVSLASGTGIATKQDELDFVCKEIQRSARKSLSSNDEEEIFSVLNDCGDKNQEVEGERNKTNNSSYSWSLEDFEFGSVIAKGCNAVVYASKIKESVFNRLATLLEISNNGFSNIGCQEIGSSNRKEKEIEEIARSSKFNTDEKFMKPSRVANDALVQKELASEEECLKSYNKIEYPLAIKMMFNYDVESNAQVIFRAMYREIVIARKSSIPDEIAEWSRGLHSRKKTLPPHPNIIEMHLAFTDFIPNLSKAMDLYPDALPQRLNPNGAGRNMSLFLVMKRYDCTLRDFLQTFKVSDKQTLNWKTSIVLLTQLLEGIAHMVEHKIAHRDLKSDNILVNLASSPDLTGVQTAQSNTCHFPHLVISDFGCCLADSKLGLKMPYSTYDTDRGGNIALMAPEVYNAEPGMFSSINYSKSDVWSAGAIAYELFGAPNPFYHDPKSNGKGKKGNVKNRCASSTDFPPNVPSVVAKLISEMLNDNPTKRISAKHAANICQLLLWAPSAWTNVNKPSSNDSSTFHWKSERNQHKSCSLTDEKSTHDILQWLLTLTTKVLYESRFTKASNIGNTKSEPGSYEYQLVATFLSRINLHDIKLALNWIQQN